MLYLIVPLAVLVGIIWALVVFPSFRVVAFIRRVDIDYHVEVEAHCYRFGRKPKLDAGQKPMSTRSGRPPSGG